MKPYRLDLTGRFVANSCRYLRALAFFRMEVSECLDGVPPLPSQGPCRFYESLPLPAAKGGNAYARYPGCVTY